MSLNEAFTRPKHLPERKSYSIEIECKIKAVKSCFLFENNSWTVIFFYLRFCTLDSEKVEINISERKKNIYLFTQYLIFSKQNKGTLAIIHLQQTLKWKIMVKFGPVKQ